MDEFSPCVDHVRWWFFPRSGIYYNAIISFVLCLGFDLILGRLENYTIVGYIVGSFMMRLFIAG